MQQTTEACEVHKLSTQVKVQVLAQRNTSKSTLNFFYSSNKDKKMEIINVLVPTDCGTVSKGGADLKRYIVTGGQFINYLYIFIHDFYKNRILQKVTNDVQLNVVE